MIFINLYTVWIDKWYNIKNQKLIVYRSSNLIIKFNQRFFSFSIRNSLVQQIYNSSFQLERIFNQFKQKKRKLNTQKETFHLRKIFHSNNPFLSTYHPLLKPSLNVTLPREKWEPRKVGGKGSQTSGKPAIPTLSRDRTRGTSIIKQLFFSLFSCMQFNQRWTLAPQRRKATTCCDM